MQAWGRPQATLAATGRRWIADAERAVAAAQSTGALSRRPSVRSTHSHAQLGPEASFPEIGLSSHRPKLEHWLLSDRLDLYVRALAAARQT